MESPSSEPQPTQPLPAVPPQPQNSPTPESPVTHSGLMWGIFACFVIIIVILFAAYFFGFYPWKIETRETVTTVTNTNVAANTNSAVNTNGAINTNNNSNTNTNTTNTNTSQDTATSDEGMEDATVAYVTTIDTNESGPATLNKISLDNPTAPETLLAFTDTSYLDAYDNIALYVSSLSPHILYQYDTTTKKSTALITLTTKHSFAGARLSPDKTTLVYSDQCGFFCVEADDLSNATTVVRSLNLQTLKQTDLFTEKGKAQGFKSIHGWLDNDTTIIVPGFESTEGALTIPQIEFLDIDTKKMSTFTLDPNARYFAAASNGTKIAYTTFTADINKQTHKSTLVIKYVDGSRTDVIETSDTLEFREAFWMIAASDEFNEGMLALMTSAVDKVTDELGYNVTGTKTMYFSVESNWTMGRMASDSKPDRILSAGKNDVVFTEKTDTNVFRIKVYDLTTGKTDTVLSNLQYANALPSRFE